MLLNPPLKALIYTSFALVAFAGNSIICRLALKSGEIDAASFTNIRLISGAFILYLLLRFRTKVKLDYKLKNYLPSIMLFGYAALFSFAYLSLDTGVGALILFGTVQVTMICASLMSGKQIRIREWVGLLLAISGFTFLMLPGQTTPSLNGFLLMSLAGFCWGVYTLKGKDSKAPLSDTALNFVKCLPLVAILFIFNLKSLEISSYGILLACLSGIFASGMGYALWYAVLPSLSNTLSASLQLLVPIIASLGGFLITEDKMTLQFVIASVLVLGGIALILDLHSAVKNKFSIKK